MTTCHCIVSLPITCGANAMYLPLDSTSKWETTGTDLTVTLYSGSRGKPGQTERFLTSNLEELSWMVAFLYESTAPRADGGRTAAATKGKGVPNRADPSGVFHVVPQCAHGGLRLVLLSALDGSKICCALTDSGFFLVSLVHHHVDRFSAWSDCLGFASCRCTCCLAGPCVHLLAKDASFGKGYYHSCP